MIAAIRLHRRLKFGRPVHDDGFWLRGHWWFHHWWLHWRHYWLSHWRLNRGYNFWAVGGNSVAQIGHGCQEAIRNSVDGGRYRGRSGIIRCVICDQSG